MAKPPAKPSPEAKRKQPTALLFKAVELNDMAQVKASIEAGADLFAENEDGMTAADVAVDKGHFIVAHYLLSRRMLGRTPPVALVPGKAKEAAKEAKARPKRKFASPRPKPETKPEVKPEPIPAPPPMVVTVPKPEAPEEIAAAPETAPKTAPETGEVPVPDKPLSEEGVAGFFKRLVDLITPGGEKPSAIPSKTAKIKAPVEPVVEPVVEPAPGRDRRGGRKGRRNKAPQEAILAARDDQQVV